MNGKELSIALRELACSQPTPLCAEWTKAWKDDSSIDELLDKYVRGFDFCVKNDYPSLDFCRKHFKKEDLHRHHIYLDEEVNIDEAWNGTYIFLGQCTGRISFDGYAAGMVYLRHSSRVDVASEDLARVFVTMYDDSDCEVQQTYGSRVQLYDRRDYKKG